MLAGGDIALVVEVEVLAAGQGSPGDQPLDVEAVSRVRPATSRQPGPDRAVEQPPRLPVEISESGAYTPGVGRQVGQRQTSYNFV